MTVIHRVTAIYRAVIYRFDCIKKKSNKPGNGTFISNNFSDLVQHSLVPWVPETNPPLSFTGLSRALKIQFNQLFR